MIRIKLFLVIIEKKYIWIKVILVTELKDMREEGGVVQTQPSRLKTSELRRNHHNFNSKNNRLFRSII